MITKKEIKSAAKVLAARARKAGKRAAERMAVATDTALVEAGQAAKRRQRSRSAKAALKAAGRVVAVAGATAATAALVRAGIRRRRERTTPLA